MRFTADIRLYDQADEAYSCLKAEKEVKTERSSFEVAKEDDHVLVRIQAKDAVALRSTFNSITKLLTVYENMKDIQDG